MKVVDPDSLGLDSVVLENIRQYLNDTYVDDGKYVGTMTLVSRKGQVAYLDSLGFMDRENKRPMQEDAIFRIYSMSKAITSIAIMQLYEKSKFRLDDPVYWYIPSWKNLRVYQSGVYPNFLTSRPERHMTIRDLLTHMSGLTYDFMYKSNVDAAYRKTKVQQAETLEEFIEILSTLPLEFSPGNKWNYSVSTDVLGYLVEVISGMKLEEYFKTNIFEPLNMEDTSFSCPQEKVDRLASLYEHVPNGEPRLLEIPFLNTKMASGGGGLFSTMVDYHNFCSMLLNQGEFNGKRLIGRKTLELMTVNHLPNNQDLTEMSESAFSETPYAGVGFGLGFSVMLDPAKSQTTSDIGEYGWGGAASTVFMINPKEDMFIIFLTQLLPSSTYQVRRELRSLVYSSLMPE
jgi:CubicO group peptidase (beta-lactamase class C family)|uniref:Beta-lactamase n=1 Tax=uncultured marine bacterium EB0_39H12 TaxID=415437 RepID=A4GHR8_9BACT|nr:beta-lactamase [uncultured marine bacterium EB0_39H12]